MLPGAIRNRNNWKIGRTWMSVNSRGAYNNKTKLNATWRFKRGKKRYCRNFRRNKNIKLL